MLLVLLLPLLVLLLLFVVLLLDSTSMPLTIAAAVRPAASVAATSFRIASVCLV